MGNNTSRNTPSNLKLESQKIVEFKGRSKDWQKWKTRTKCTFDSSVIDCDIGRDCVSLSEAVQKKRKMEIRHGMRFWSGTMET
eukprot:1680404-Ditylum_brightwellii.AAC.1